MGFLSPFSGTKTTTTTNTFTATDSFNTTQSASKVLSNLGNTTVTLPPASIADKVEQFLPLFVLGFIGFGAILLVRGKG